MQKDRNPHRAGWSRRARLYASAAAFDRIEFTAEGPEMSGKPAYGNALARALPGAVHHTEPGRHVVMLPCRRCPGLVEAFSSPNHIPPEIIPQKIRERGWLIGRTAAKHQCPNHAKEKPMPSPSTAAAAPVPTPDARAAGRAAMDWLGESFDLTSGRYSPGVSDATIAKEVGMSELAIAQLREQFFGPLREPSEIEAIRAQLNGLEDQASTLVGNAERLSTSLLAEVKEIGRKLDRLTQANGWKS